MAKLKETGKLAGIANVIPHQFIISDLIFGIRKRFAKNKKASAYRVISEISLSEIGTIYNDKKFTKNHNIDLVIIDAKSRDIVFIPGLITFAISPSNCESTSADFRNCSISSADL